jgi:hypothetical protein
MSPEERAEEEQELLEGLRRWVLLNLAAKHWARKLWDRPEEKPPSSSPAPTSSSNQVRRSRSGPRRTPRIISLAFSPTARMRMPSSIFRRYPHQSPIVAVLVSDPNADVRVIVEISADFPEGAKDTTKRAVCENARSMSRRVGLIFVE